MSESVSFDRAASYYDDTRGFPAGVETQVAQMIAQTGQLNTQTKLLEIGIGTGRIGLPLAHHVAGVYGVDISAQMLNILREKQQAEPVYVTWGDASRLPFPDNSFDAAVDVHVFHLIPTWRAVLRELGRVLKTGAQLLHGYNGSSTLDEVRWAAFQDEEPHTKGVPWLEIENFLGNAGWQKTLVNEHTYTYSQVPNVLLSDLEKRVWSRTWFMSEMEIARVRRKMEAALNERFADPTQPAIVTASFNIEVYTPPAI